MKTTVNNKKRLVIAYVIFACIIFALCIRTGYVMLVKGGEYGGMAAQQQMQDEILQPERGEILDRNGNELAVNLEAYSVWVRRDEVVKNMKGCHYRTSACDFECTAWRPVNRFADKE